MKTRFNRFAQVIEEGYNPAVSIYRFIPLVLVLLSSGITAGEFQHEGDVSVRYDNRSDRPSREQYRLRWWPKFDFENQWSVHAYVATGAAFPSAYNTFGGSDELNVRRLFGRWADGGHKLEFGVIPPYKGRVSSTGLSDEGWIRGVRGVIAFRDDRLEIVVGDLNSLRASRAFSSPLELNYFEVEWSGRLNDVISYELGGERMLEENYLRTELRLTTRSDYAWSAEFVHSLTSNSTKSTISFLAPFSYQHGQLKWFTYYSYVPLEFGARAILTEDFLGFDHALGTKLEYRHSRLKRVKWFAEFEIGDARNRVKLGFEFDFGG